MVAFLQDHRAVLAALTSVRVLHGDLTTVHVVLRRGWRIGGLIDFADAQLGPCEAEFLLPFVQLFPGDGAAQRRLLRAYGYPEDRWEALPALLMGLLLTHRFAAVHEWLAPWMATSPWTFASIAARIFPIVRRRRGPPPLCPHP